MMFQPRACRAQMLTWQVRPPARPDRPDCGVSFLDSGVGGADTGLPAFFARIRFRASDFRTAHSSWVDGALQSATCQKQLTGSSCSLAGPWRKRRCLRRKGLHQQGTLQTRNSYAFCNLFAMFYRYQHFRVVLLCGIWHAPAKLGVGSLVVPQRDQRHRDSLFQGCSQLGHCASGETCFQ